MEAGSHGFELAEFLHLLQYLRFLGLEFLPIDELLNHSLPLHGAHLHLRCHRSGVLLEHLVDDPPHYDLLGAPVPILEAPLVEVGAAVLGSEGGLVVVGVGGVVGGELGVVGGVGEVLAGSHARIYC